MKKTTLDKEKTICITRGNRKTGGICSVNLPPIITCVKCAECHKFCYALNDWKRFPNVRKAYTKNLHIWENESNLFFEQVQEFARLQLFFRWFCSGDIPTLDFFANMVQIAKNLPMTHFLVFTKKYDIVNEYISLYNDIPSNFFIKFSEDKKLTLSNPYNLPTARVIYTLDQHRENAILCGGYCPDCIFVEGCSCFTDNCNVDFLIHGCKKDYWKKEQEVPF